MKVPTSKFYLRVSYVAFAFLICCLVFFAWTIIAVNFGGNKLDKEIHYIPKGYIGDVHVFFKKRDGLPKERENDYRVYRIQKSGILKTRFKKNLGITSNINEDLKFYYIDNGKEYDLQLITKIQEVEGRLDSNTVVVVGFGYKTGYENITGRMESVLTYSVDSIKNINRDNDSITPSKYINWKD